MQLTDEQFATLAPYEAHFTTALRSSQPPSLSGRAYITPDDLAPAKRTQTVTIGHEWPDTDR